ncbi:hypothetical protein PO878_12910 [Iamia majanohamensis]|uniref:Uncharacterized protein n=1 Tax=Iamia majanohamensis TaxID=467976 RepID=A0AAE9Y3K5_9ACTN|nr:hypothetical protein [Iamia majanohamensis]WCO65397.1 hypothetical protein PO878_12910 [Iamia majanohamensis]
MAQVRSRPVPEGPDAPEPGVPAGRPASTRLAPGWLLALMVANTVTAIGLFGDIARHVSLAATLEGDAFLAGWHLVLYGGVAGGALVLGALAFVHGPAAPWRALPAATAGVAVLTLGGTTDLLWHEAYGVEAAFQALVSPPHLLIFAGLVMLMVAPVAAVVEGPSRPVDAVRSVVLALSLTSLLLVVSLFTGYLTPLVGGSEFQAGAYQEPLIGTSLLDYDISRGLGVSLWFSALISLVVVGVRSRAAPVAGTWTLTFGLLGLAPLVATGTVTLPLTFGLVTFGLVSDLTATRRRPHPLATGLAAASLWAVLFAGVAGRGDLIWNQELWGGVVTSSFLVGAAVGAALRWIAAPTRPQVVAAEAPAGDGTP